MTLIFDYDGTLHNTAHLYGCAVRTACDWLVAEGYTESSTYTDGELSVYLGMSAEDMWNSFMPTLPKEIMRKASEMVGNEMLRQIDGGNALLYPDIPDVLDTLKKSECYRMVILSNCNCNYMTAHRKHFGLDKWFDKYYCAETFGFAPKENIFPYIKQDFPDNKYIVIGDRESDFRVGTLYNIPTIGCAYGFGTSEELNLCSAVVRKSSEIPNTVRNIFSYI